MKKDNVILRFFFDWLLVNLGVLGSIYCLITAFDLPVPYGMALAIVTAVSFYCGVLSGEKLPRWSAPLLVLGMALLGYLLREELGESFRNLWGFLCGRYVLGYDQFLDLLPREKVSVEATGPALQALGIIMALPASMAVRWWKRSLPAALALLPGIVPCFILTDTPPAVLPLLLAVFSILTQIISQSARRRNAGEQAKAVFLSALVSAAVLGLLLMIFPEKDYKQPPITWDEFTAKLDRWGAEQSNRGNVNAGLSGNPPDVDLSALGALPNRPVAVLYAESSADAYLYLRGSSYTDFDGTRWSRGAGGSWGPQALFPYLGTQEGELLRIETLDPETVLYTTYQLTELPAGGELVSDSYLSNSAETQRYSMRYILNPRSAGFDGDYDEWVRKHCLALPEQTRDGVLDWWQSHGADVERPAILDMHPEILSDSVVIRDGLISHGDVTVRFDSDSFYLPDLSEAVEEYAQAVASRVSRCARYSRNPLRMPEGQDFCTWFLKDAKEGYCVHYASACTALLRALGIPARYVSGYVCPAEAGRRTEVTNLHAHAWVEIWSGGRWVVIEPTPEDATEFTGQTYNGNTPADSTEESTEPTSPELPTDTMEPMTGRFTEPTRPTRPSSEPGESGQPSGNGGGKSVNMTPIWIFLGTAGFLALVLGRRLLCQRLRERRFARAEGNDKARLLYRRILRLQRLSHGIIPADVHELAKKAAFSQHALEPEELHYLQQACDHQAGRLAIAGFWKRILCKYVLCVI